MTFNLYYTVKTVIARIYRNRRYYFKLNETFAKRPFLLNFCVPDGRDLRFATTSSNFNPRNTQCIRARPVKCEAYFSGVVKISAFLELKQKLTFFKGL